MHYVAYTSVLVTVHDTNLIILVSLTASHEQVERREVGLRLAYVHVRGDCGDIKAMIRVGSGRYAMGGATTSALGQVLFRTSRNSEFVMRIRFVNTMQGGFNVLSPAPQHRNVPWDTPVGLLGKRLHPSDTSWGDMCDWDDVFLPGLDWSP